MAPRGQRVAVGIVGPSNKARSVTQQSGRTVNLYPEVNDPDSKSVVALYSAPGYFRWANLTALVTEGAAIRAVHIMGSRFFLVAGASVYEVEYDETLQSFNTLTELDTLATDEGRVGMSDNNGILVLGDGTGFFSLDPDSPAITPILNEDLDVIPGTFSRFFDGYTLFFQADTGLFYYSAINDATTVEGLNYMSAEGSPDNTVAALVINRQAIILGSESIEFHYNSGDADNPFQRIAGGFIEHGCAARWSAVKFDNTAVFVGRNSEGQGVVWRLGGAGAEPQRISSHAVEKCIEKVLFAGVARDDLTEQITAYADQVEGHPRYVLNLPAVPATTNSPAQPSMTWAYDASTRLWCELGSMNPTTGLFERARADQHVIWRGRHYYGSYSDPWIYELSPNYYREGEDRYWVKFRESSHLSFDGRRFKINALTIEMETGVGRDGAVQGSNPTIMLQVSWDGGRTFGSIVTRSIGAIGEYQTEVRFGPLGSGRDCVLRLSISDPVRVCITGAHADVEVGR